MSQPLDFQSIILKLQQYWNEQGCLIWQPYYTQVGAGTMNPATSLRVLGPEPWNVAYVEPSVRPDDGRYGENPNRLQQHYQFQVILKPDPGNPQEIYLKSLEAIGINPAEHDIRFVEDNWESPALGAWGLGWEVWLDGQEITQFTYFQQAGGMPADPVSVEITYGLERIAMALQKVRDFRDIRWSSSRTYGDVNLIAEQEHSQYYFEVANVDRLREMYDLYEAEAEAALNLGLVLPAHDYVLKCSHTFNILDTRGAVGVTERQALFSRMRELSRRVAEAYYEQRKTMEYPWLKEASSETIVSVSEDTLPVIQSPSDFLFEIGVEELPVNDLNSVLKQLEERFTNLFEELRLDHGDLKVYGTPRRLLVSVADLAERQKDLLQVVKGPPANRAFDADGNPTKAAIGFARGKGVDVEDLQVKEVDGGSYVTVEVHEEGQPTINVLANALAQEIAALRFDKSMRWNESGVSFSRPIRWLLALFGNELVPFEYAGIHSQKITRGLRFVEPEQAEIKSAADYFSFMQRQGIILDVDERKDTIRDQVKAVMQKVGADVSRFDEDLLDEVTLLVEAPTAFTGTFESEYLNLPSEVLISVMKKHQRYFPVFDLNGKLMPYFVGVRNGDDRYLENVADGNEQVVRARFADAAFFIREDLKTSLAEIRPSLSTLTFQVKLGSMLDKTERIEKIVNALLEGSGLDEAEARFSRRAASLCKADLMTHMVVEMTSLQGVMGRFYANHSGEPEAVGKAIYEHYLPRFSGDQMPSTKAGLLVGLADRLDTLSGLFAAGLAPTGTKDPFAQRRAALGLVQILVAWNLEFDLREGLKLAASFLPIEMSQEKQDACIEFISGRLQNWLLEQGYKHDVVAAVINEQGYNPASASSAVETLTKWVERSDWDLILPTYSRCVRITRDLTQEFAIDPSLLEEDAERELYAGVTSVMTVERRAGSVTDFFQVFMPLMPVINQFFDEVLVMAEDPAVKANRLGMLQRIAALANGVVDFTQLEGF
ncbi:MAG: glycine--tRNA ligase subunit alpha/beta [Anaerolineaceae bacterium]|nr:glycine--tRNA ligase subunit alpha/beta [Anaerolineaceae bacterium]